ncbi:MAG: LemA family protein [Rhizomicrobium sp.]
MRKMSKALPKIVVALGLFLTLAGCGVNAIPAKDEAVKAAWGDVQAAYQRRSDLIPNLVATVKAYAVQEKTVLIQVTQARAQATHVSVDASTISNPAVFQRFQAAQNQLSGVLGHLLSITENYPNLKSNQNFLALQAQLEGTENRIEIARRDYNAAVQDYNTELRTYPGVIWASTLYKAQKPAQEFSASAAAQGAPVVNFTGGAEPPQPTAPPPPPVNP